MLRTRNNPGEDEQIGLDGKRNVGHGDLRFSKFRHAAIEVSNHMHVMVGGGDKINVLEEALERAYTLGGKDAIKQLRDRIETLSAGGTVVELGEAYYKVMSEVSK